VRSSSWRECVSGGLKHSNSVIVDGLAAPNYSPAQAPDGTGKIDGLCAPRMRNLLITKEAGMRKEPQDARIMWAKVEIWGEINLAKTPMTLSQTADGARQLVQRQLYVEKRDGWRVASHGS